RASRLEWIYEKTAIFMGERVVSRSSAGRRAESGLLFLVLCYSRYLLSAVRAAGFEPRSTFFRGCSRFETPWPWRVYGRRWGLLRRLFTGAAASWRKS